MPMLCLFLKRGRRVAMYYGAVREAWARPWHTYGARAGTSLTRRAVMTRTRFEASALRVSIPGAIACIRGQVAAGVSSKKARFLMRSGVAGRGGRNGQTETPTGRLSGLFCIGQCGVSGNYGDSALIHAPTAKPAGFRRLGGLITVLSALSP